MKVKVVVILKSKWNLPEVFFVIIRRQTTLKYFEHKL